MHELHTESMFFVKVSKNLIKYTDLNIILFCIIKIIM